MRAHAGLVRSAGGLAGALARLAAFPLQMSNPDSDAITAANAALVARLIVTSALLREESRGAHFRGDFQQSNEAWRAHIVLARGQAPWAVEMVAGEVECLADAIT